MTETKLDYNVDSIIEDATQGDVQVIESHEQDSEDLEKQAGESPIIKFVNYLISHAIRQGASDIHIEPKEDHTKIRFRIDGILFDAMKPPQTMHSAVVSRLKIMSNLDISERRIPQDGRISAIVGGREIDLRVSTLPTSCGEKVVIRVLDSKSILRGLEELGMAPEALDAFKGGNYSTARHYPCYRADRLRKDNDTVFGAEPDGRRNDEYIDGGRPGGISFGLH